MLELMKTIWGRLLGRPTPPPKVIVTREGGAYPLTLDADGRWLLHSADSEEVVNGIAHALRITAQWQRDGIKPPVVKF